MIENQPCLIDLYNTQEIIQHFRDLISIGPMLDCDYEDAIWKFRKKLRTAGYSEERITQFIQLACFGTVWESYIPPPIKNRGDYWEWLKKSARFR